MVELFQLWPSTCCLSESQLVCELSPDPSFGSSQPAQVSASCGEERVCSPEGDGVGDPVMPARNCLRMPCGESYVESRMRENRTYGSERGCEPKGSPLPLWIGPSAPPTHSLRTPEQQTRSRVDAEVSRSRPISLLSCLLTM